MSSNDQEARDKRAVRAYMRRRQEGQHPYDNATELAEAAAHEALGTEDHDDWLDDPDHWVWEIAAEFF